MAFISPFHVRINSVFYRAKISRKNAQDPAGPGEPWIQDPSGFCRFSWGLNHFIKELPYHITRYNMDNQAQNLEVP